jgi:hypothetical protein
MPDAVYARWVVRIRRMGTCYNARMLWEAL